MLERITCTKADLTDIHESLRAMYGDGMPLRTYNANGVRVRVFGADLPSTPEENRKRLRAAYAIADGIAARAAERGDRL